LCDLSALTICAGKDFKNKAKSHITVDCYDKPGNEDKHPHRTSSQKLSPLGPRKNKNQLFRAWLMKLLEEESDNPESPPEDVNVNSQLRKSLILFLQVGRKRGLPNWIFP